MIATVLMVSLRRLLHNRIELLLTFIVPIAFFSIFAIIFGGGVGASSTPKIKVVVVDQVDTPQSRALIAAFHEIKSLRFVDTDNSTTPSASTSTSTSASTRATQSPPLSEEKARELVKRGTAAMAIVLRIQNNAITADLLSDTSDQVAPQIVSALVQRAMLGTSPFPGVIDGSGASTGFSPAGSANTAAPGYRSLAPGAPSDQALGERPLTGDVQQTSTQQPPNDINPPQNVAQAGGLTASRSVTPFVPPTVRIVDVLGGTKSNPVISMYAAGIAVMFLLFGATGGGGALLEERENQTLDRLLTTGLSMDELLLGKWFYLTALGVLQTTVMFVWGQLMFGVELTSHLDGFFIMTLVTAGAAAAFGLLLATICKTRGQLNGLSVVVVLTMSALGGSMVPRYVMSQSLRDAGLWTFNAWALEGYEKVFWRDLPAIELWPQMSVLMLCGLTFLISARLLATRWETE